MAKKRDIKKHFEAILGRQLDFPSDEGIVTRETIGIFMKAVDGFVTPREI